MLNKEHGDFLSYVFEYINKFPEAAPDTVGAVNGGLKQSLQETNERAADMESALVISLNTTNKKMKNDNEFIKQKIKKWQHKSALAWDWFLNKR